MDFSRWSEAHHQQQQAQSTTASEAYAQFYNAHQHPYAHFPYYSHHQNPSAGQSNSSKNPSAAQFESASSDAGLRPPGIDAYAPNPYLPHGGYDVQSAPLPYGHGQMMQAGAAAAAYFQDPSVHQSYAIQQAGADHVAYAATLGLTNGMIGPHPNPMWNNSTGCPFVKGAKRAPKKTKIVQSAWCEICKIECNSIDVLEKHKQGKKHKKNLEKLEETKKNLAAAVMPQNQVAVNKQTPGETSIPVSGQATRRKGGPASEEDLEAKRRKLMESGAAAESLRVCAICNVAVNSETVFNFHLQGQKHAAQLKKRAAAGAPAVVTGPQAVTAA